MSYNYNSTIVERHDFNSTIKKISNYDSILVYKRYFNSSMDGFAQTNTYYVKFIQPSVLNISGISFARSASAIFSASPMNFTVNSNLMSLSNSSSAIFIQNSRMGSNARTDVSISGITFNQGSNFTLTTNNQLNINSFVFNSSSIVFSACPVVADYYLLSDWDASNLSDLDTKTLQEMDYQSV
jgi:hypothetical protein